jgi:hypothetical protein
VNRRIESLIVRYVAVIAGLFGTMAVFGRLANPHGFDWNVAAGTATAYGTLALALVTWRLVSLTQQETHGTLQLAAYTARERWDRLRAEQRATLERVLESIYAVRDAAIFVAQVRGQGSEFEIAVRRLGSAIVLAGPVDLGSSVELTQVGALDAVDQAVEAEAEVLQLLSTFDDESERDAPPLPR